MAAFEILGKLNGIDAHSLKPLQRILLITDGTLTEILEAHFLEPIKLVKLSQQAVASAPAGLEPDADEKFMERKILLRGANSGNTYVYAKSTIAFGRLSDRMQKELLESDVPLGRLWLEHRLETFKELTDIQCRPANDLSPHFGCKASSHLLARTYRVIANARPVMVITEYFPLE